MEKYELTPDQAIKYLIDILMKKEEFNWFDTVRAIAVVIEWITEQFGGDEAKLLGAVPSEEVEQESTVELLRSLEFDAGALKAKSIAIPPILLRIVLERLVNWLLELMKEKLEA